MSRAFNQRVARFIPLFCLLLAARTGVGQGWIGLAQSNYGGTNSLYINPSALADSRHKFYLNVAGADFNFYNTYIQLDLPGPAREFLDGTRELKREYLTEQLSGGTKFASVTGELRLPSLMISLGPRQGLAFTNRVRAFVQASNVSENLARLARYGLGQAGQLGLANRLLSDNSFNLSVGAYHEFALSYARTLTTNQEHFWKVGGTVKYLVGLGGGYLLNEGTQYQVYSADSVQLQSRNLSYGFVNTALYKQPGFGAGMLYSSQRPGQGFGLDLGATYEWRPEYDQYQYHMDGQDWTDNSRNKYRLRVGLALTDLGAISYNNSQYVQQAQLANTRTVQLGHLDTIKIRNADQIRNTAQRLVGLSSQSTKFTSYLPTTLRLTADYRLVNHLFAGLLWTQNVLPASTIGQRSISSLALTPRIEFSHAEIAVPLILANNYRKFQLGAMVRLGPLVVGSDNLGGLVNLTGTTGADLYFGLNLALQKHKHKDKDGDQVSNKLDKCPKVKGTWEFRGCPDRDNDHVQDAVDECPDVPGLPQFKGCPDTDGDGIPDKLDACPKEAGLVQFQGCPDRDKDGVKDAEDACPDVPGPPALHGCPDRDGDGVTDADDQCPDVAGPAEHHGCPDTDQDGLYDQEDGCPTVAGPVENKGCPYPDTDGDTVLDKDDACPAVAGPVANKGCPLSDEDGDGVLDKDDACPKTPGPASNKGCPMLLKEEVKILNTAFANLEFETGKAIIKATSFFSLNELAQLLHDKPTFRLRLSGYTDNVGKPAQNLLLSKQRTLAVSRYLVQQGVPATQIKSEWFGQAKPKASNKTAAGRARNRRVEMKVMFE